MAFSDFKNTRKSGKKPLFRSALNRESTTYAPPQAKNPSKIALLSNCPKFPCISTQTLRAFSALAASHAPSHPAAAKSVRSRPPKF
jgi:hypothetical protein